jgi:hypothetical protein
MRGGVSREISVNPGELVILSRESSVRGWQVCWCLHFISSNYVVFKDKEEFSQLVGDNMDYISQHQWPPLSSHGGIQKEIP